MPTSPTCSRRAGSPGCRLALVTVPQFREDLPDRQAAGAVRARIDWKYLLGLGLTDPGFDPSVLCGFRARLVAGGAEERLPHRSLDRRQALGLLEARGRRRTDATRVLAAIRALNRPELVGGTPRAALNEPAAAAPAWLRERGRPEWLERYAVRVDVCRLPGRRGARIWGRSRASSG